MLMKKRFLSMLVLLAAVVTGAWAQTETLLTTITATGDKQASYSTANVATVSFSCTQNGSLSYLANWGWWGYDMTLTVTAAEGYTITKCIFYDDANRTATDSEAPFVVETIGEQDKTPRINGTPIDGGNMQSKGIKKIEVYGYATPAATGYNITLDEGTGNKDSQNWEITPKSSELGGGEAVTVKYNGSREVKSVTVVKKAAVNPNAYMKWDNTKKELVATLIPENATAVTNAEANVNWSAGTYVVDDGHMLFLLKDGLLECWWVGCPVVLAKIIDLEVVSLGKPNHLAMQFAVEYVLVIVLEFVVVGLGVGKEACLDVVLLPIVYVDEQDSCVEVAVFWVVTQHVYHFGLVVNPTVFDTAKCFAFDIGLP